MCICSGDSVAADVTCYSWWPGLAPVCLHTLALAGRVQLHVGEWRNLEGRFQTLSSGPVSHHMTRCRSRRAASMQLWFQQVADEDVLGLECKQRWPTIVLICRDIRYIVCVWCHRHVPC